MKKNKLLKFIPLALGLLISIIGILFSINNKVYASDIIEKEASNISDNRNDASINYGITDGYYPYVSQVGVDLYNADSTDYKNYANNDSIAEVLEDNSITFNLDFGVATCVYVPTFSVKIKNYSTSLIDIKVIEVIGEETLEYSVDAANDELELKGIKYVLSSGSNYYLNEDFPKISIEVTNNSTSSSELYGLFNLTVTATSIDTKGYYPSRSTEKSVDLPIAFTNVSDDISGIKDASIYISEAKSSENSGSSYDLKNKGTYGINLDYQDTYSISYSFDSELSVTTTILTSDSSTMLINDGISYSTTSDYSISRLQFKNSGRVSLSYYSTIKLKVLYSSGEYKEIERNVFSSYITFVAYTSSNLVLSFDDEADITTSANEYYSKYGKNKVISATLDSSTFNVKSDLFSSFDLSYGLFSYSISINVGDTVIVEDSDNVTSNEVYMLLSSLAEKSSSLEFSITISLYDNFIKSLYSGYNEDESLLYTTSFDITIDKNTLPDEILLDQESYDFTVSEYNTKCDIEILNYALLINVGDVLVSSINGQITFSLSQDSSGVIKCSAKLDCIDYLSIVVTSKTSSQTKTKVVRVTYQKQVETFGFDVSSVSLKVDESIRLRLGTYINDTYSAYDFSDKNNFSTPIISKKSNIVSASCDFSLGDQYLYLDITGNVIGQTTIYFTMSFVDGYRLTTDEVFKEGVTYYEYKGGVYKAITISDSSDTESDNPKYGDEITSTYYVLNEITFTADLDVTITEDDDVIGDVTFKAGSEITYLLQDTSNHYLYLDTPISAQFQFLSLDTNVITVEAVSYDECRVILVGSGETTLVAYYNANSGKSYTATIKVMVLDKEPDITINISKPTDEIYSVSVKDLVTFSFDSGSFSFSSSAVFKWQIDGKEDTTLTNSLFEVSNEEYQTYLEEGIHEITLIISDSEYGINMSKSTKISVTKEVNKLKEIEICNTNDLDVSYDESIYLDTNGSALKITSLIDMLAVENIDYVYSLSNTDYVTISNSLDNNEAVIRPIKDGAVTLTVMANIKDDTWIKRELKINVITVTSISISMSSDSFKPGDSLEVIVLGNGVSVSNMDFTSEVTISGEVQEDYYDTNGNVLTFESLNIGTNNLKISYDALENPDYNFTIEVTNFNLRKFIFQILPYLIILVAIIVFILVITRGKKNQLKNTEDAINKLQVFITDARMNSNKDNYQELLKQSSKKSYDVLKRLTYLVDSGVDEASVLVPYSEKIYNMISSSIEAELPLNKTKAIYRGLLENEIKALKDYFIELRKTREEHSKKKNEDSNVVLKKEKKKKETKDERKLKSEKYLNESNYAEAYDISEEAQGLDDSTDDLD